MGRSVSYPSNCTAVCFQNISSFGWEKRIDCIHCGYEFPEEMEGENCPSCGEEIAYTYYEDSAYIDFDWFLQDIIELCQENWPSLEKCDEWIGYGRSEDKALLENNFCYIGVSTYCGLASVWLLSKSQYGGDYDTKDSLADNWCNQISPKFKAFFDEYVKIATFSNGEAMYEKVA